MPYYATPVQPVYLQPAGPPPYRAGASISWVIVALVNTLGCVASGLLTVVALVGFGAAMAWLQQHATGANGDQTNSALAVLGGSGALIAAGVLLIGFLFALLFTILSWKRVWGGLVVQTVFLTLQVLAGTAWWWSVRGDESSAAVPVTAMLPLWIGCALWLLFTILTAPGIARRRYE